MENEEDKKENQARAKQNHTPKEESTLLKKEISHLLLRPFFISVKNMSLFLYRAVKA